MSKWIKPAAAGIAVLLISALLAWLSGFNFDQRNADVAYWAGVALAASAYCAGLVWVVQS